MEHVVGLGEYIVTGGQRDIIRTFALASCVAVTVYCPQRKAAGMVHVVLPSPLANGDRMDRPGYFAVTGIPLLINTICLRYGCQKEELHIQIFGGADSANQQDIYRIGARNIHAVEQTLYNMGLRILRADVRGNESRTLKMNVSTGIVDVSRQLM